MFVVPEPTNKKLLFRSQTLAKHIKQFFKKILKSKNVNALKCKMFTFQNDQISESWNRLNAF